MNFSILLDMVIELLSKRKVSANYFSEKYNLSPRTVYRYVERISQALPVSVKRGRGGGICLSDSYTLPTGFLTTQEYDAAIEALSDAYSQTQDLRFLQAKRKLSSQEKHEARTLRWSGEIDDVIFEKTAFLFPNSMQEKIRLIGACIRSLHVLEIEYIENGQRVKHKIEPHALIIEKQTVCVYAFCHVKRDFQLFRLGNIYTAFQTEESFRKRPFDQADLPFQKAQGTLNIRLEIAESALDRVYDWLGAENVHRSHGKWIADVILPDNEDLLTKLLTFGTDIQILSPKSLKEK